MIGSHLWSGPSPFSKAPNPLSAPSIFTFCSSSSQEGAILPLPLPSARFRFLSSFLASMSSCSAPVHERASILQVQSHVQPFASLHAADHRETPGGVTVRMPMACASGQAAPDRATLCQGRLQTGERGAP